MKKTVLAAAVMMSLGVQAQTSSSSSTSVAAPATQTTTATVAEIKPVAASPWSGALNVIVGRNLQDQKDNGSLATTNTINQVTLRYKATDKDTFAIGQDFTYNIVPRVEARGNGPFDTDGFTTLDPFIRWNRSLGQVLWNEKTTLALRYYLPLSNASKLAGSNGFLRAQIALPYNASKLVELEYSLDARARFSARGSETFEARNYGTLTLNLTDSFQAFTTVGVWGQFGDVGVLNKTATNGNRIYGSTGVSSSAVKDVALSVYAESVVPSRPREVYSAYNTTVNLDTVVSF